MPTTIDKIHALMNKNDEGWETTAALLIVDLYGGPLKFVQVHLDLYHNIAREAMDTLQQTTAAKIGTADEGEEG